MPSRIVLAPESVGALWNLMETVRPAMLAALESDGDLTLTVSSSYSASAFATACLLSVGIDEQDLDTIPDLCS